CVAGWARLVSERQTQVRAMAELTANQSQHAIATGVREYVLALRHLAGVWSTIGPRPVEEWRANAEALIESFPALVSVAWIHPDGRRDRMATRDTGSPAVIGLDDQTDLKQASLAGPERDDSGAIGFRVLLPVRSDRAKLGVLEARVDADRLLAEVLQQWAPGYAIRVKWNDEVLFVRDEPSTHAGLQWWKIEAPVSLVLGATWNVTLAPTPQLAAAWLTPDTHYLLALGIVLAL